MTRILRWGIVLSLVCVPIQIDQQVSAQSYPLSVPEQCQLSDSSDMPGPAGREPLELVNQIGGSSSALALENDQLFSFANIKIIDRYSLSIPEKPEFVHSFEIKELPEDGYIPDLKMDDQFLFVTTGWGLMVLDTSDPYTLTETSRISTTLSQRNSFLVDVDQGVAVLGEDTILNGMGSFGFVDIFDVSDPYHPVYLSSYDLGASLLDIDLVGDYLYITTQNPDSALYDYGLVVLDLSDPANPVRAGFLFRQYAYRTRVVDQIAYMVEHLGFGPDQLSLWYVHDPQNIMIAYAQSLTGTIPELEITELYIYFAGQDGSLEVFDNSTLLRPFPIFSLDLPGPSLALARSSPYIYIAGGDAGLQVIRANLEAVSGRVTSASGIPIPGVQVSAGPAPSVHTDDHGEYFIGNIITGTRTITPSLPGYGFSPLSRTFTLPDDPRVNQDFILLPEPLSATISPGITTTLAYTEYHGVSTSFNFLPDTFKTETNLSITPTLTTHLSGLAFTGRAFEIGLDENINFTASVTVNLGYASPDLNLLSDPAGLQMRYRLPSGSWVLAEEACSPELGGEQSITQAELNAPVCQGGVYALFGPTNSVFLPLLTN